MNWRRSIDAGMQGFYRQFSRVPRSKTQPIPLAEAH
jgi:hypothetical protein